MLTALDALSLELFDRRARQAPVAVDRRASAGGRRRYDDARTAVLSTVLEAQRRRRRSPDLKTRPI
ncbi:MAG: hypothetical protein DMF84_22100 [Acidobacteria bacterium]|nr:MAG: hypothetical protein DMF84_22100 [Acidobacteriota bacterium]